MRRKRRVPTVFRSRLNELKVCRWPGIRHPHCPSGRLRRVQAGLTEVSPVSHRKQELRIHYLQHVAFEGLGYIETWLKERHARLSSTRLFAGSDVPHPDAFDGLIVMGGPMSVHDTHGHGWLAEEYRFLADTIAAGKPIIGICLGAQLLARALGAEVYPNDNKEIGWHGVHRCEALTAPAFPLPSQATVFQWHGETFDLPVGAVRLATAQACANQAFLYGDRVLGLQFHPEMTPEGVQVLIEQCPGDLEPGPYIQTPQAMLADDSRFGASHRIMDGILRYLFLGDL